jgi:hypothetical protein
MPVQTSASVAMTPIPNDAVVFGKPLRPPNWRSLSVRQRLARELENWVATDGESQTLLGLIWHGLRSRSLATLANSDCPKGLNLCVYSNTPNCPSNIISSLILCASLFSIRTVEDDDRDAGVIVSAIPEDFHAFDEDPEASAVQSPPLMGISSTVERSASYVVKPQGRCYVVAGRYAIPKGWPEWLTTQGFTLYRSERFISATFMPNRMVEATLLRHGLYYHNATGLVPVFGKTGTDHH